MKWPAARECLLVGWLVGWLVSEGAGVNAKASRLQMPRLWDLA